MGYNPFENIFRASVSNISYNSNQCLELLHKIRIAFLWMSTLGIKSLSATKKLKTIPSVLFINELSVCMDHFSSHHITKENCNCYPRKLLYYFKQIRVKCLQFVQESRQLQFSNPITNTTTDVNLPFQIVSHFGRTSCILYQFC